MQLDGGKGPGWGTQALVLQGGHSPGQTPSLSVPKRPCAMQPAWPPPRGACPTVPQQVPAPSTCLSSFQTWATFDICSDESHSSGEETALCWLPSCPLCHLFSKLESSSPSIRASQGPGSWPIFPPPGRDACWVLVSPPWLQPGCWGWDGAIVNDFSGNSTTQSCCCLGHSCRTHGEVQYPKVMCVAAPPQPRADINPC